MDNQFANISNSTNLQDIVPVAKDIFIFFIVLHWIGFLLVLLNACYLMCTRGYGSVRIGRNMKDLEIRRCCKMRKAVACNILIMYQIVLVACEIVMAIVFHSLQFSNDSTQPAFWFWLLVAGNYTMLMCCCIPGVLNFNAFKSHSHIGPLHGCNAFECLNFVIFWVSVTFVTICQLTDCTSLPFGLRILGDRAALIPAIIAYVGMLVGSFYNRKSFGVYKKVISKHEAVTILKQKLEEWPSIEWLVRCGHNEEPSGEWVLFLFFRIAIPDGFVKICLFVTNCKNLKVDVGHPHTQKLGAAYITNFQTKSI